MADLPQPDWDLGTWEGAKREQLRRWMKLSLREKLEALESMGELARHFAERRRQQGLPYFDPATGKLIAD
jgi:hypothetical protein